MASDVLRPFRDSTGTLKGFSSARMGEYCTDGAAACGQEFRTAALAAFLKPVLLKIGHFSAGLQLARTGFQARARHGWSALSACWARRLQALLHHASTRLRSVALVQLRLPAYPAHKNLRARALLRTYSIERKTPHLDRVEPP